MTNNRQIASIMKFDFNKCLQNIYIEYIYVMKHHLVDTSLIKFGICFKCKNCFFTIVWNLV